MIPAAPSHAIRVAFVNYGEAGNNSSRHIRGFGTELRALGHEVTYYDRGPDPHKPEGEPGALVYHPHALRPPAWPQTGAPDIIHGWTPRNGVRRFVHRLRWRVAIPYLVHLEDNEQHLTESFLGQPHIGAWTRPIRALMSGITHPRAGARFLARAAGATVITPALAEFLPAALPWHVLEPGVDAERFAPAPPARREAIRARLGLPGDTRFLVYTGNTHHANRAEVTALYDAVRALHGEGHALMLLRTGHAGAEGAGAPPWLRQFGVLPEEGMIDLLRLADFLVQPGAPDQFNRYRLPSKLPEFLAMGRPVILPRANIGLELEDGVEAITMARGDAAEIIACLRPLLADEDRARDLGRAGRAFAMRRFSWRRSAEALAVFYASLWRSRPAAAG